MIEKQTKKLNKKQPKKIKISELQKIVNEAIRKRDGNCKIRDGKRQCNGVLTASHYPAPKCDNERLLKLQYDYKENGNAKALTAMYALGCKIALKYINAKAGKNPHIAHMGDDEKEEKAHNAITYIIARYLRVKDFRIEKSFTSYLYLRVQHELFYTRKIDKIVSFVENPYDRRGRQ